MLLKTLQEKMKYLKRQVELLPEAASLHEKVALIYNERTLKDLNIALNKKPSMSQTPADNLRGYLSQNWALINGSFLSYTCLPNTALTQLLCEVAGYVAEEENKKGCYVLSMSFIPQTISEIPLCGINSACLRIIEREADKVCWLPLNEAPQACSLIDMGDFNEGYIRSFNQLSYINKNKKQLIRLIISTTQLAELDDLLGHPEALMTLSEQQLESLRTLPGHPPTKFNGLYYANEQKNQLIPLDVTKEQLHEFDQTILPKSTNAMLPLESIPDCCGNLSQIISPCSVIKLLMPTVSIVSYSDDYEDLDSDVTILNTHILGEKGAYLIPIKLVTQLNLSAEAPLLPNPYYDYTVHPEHARYFNLLDSNERWRLTAHSDLTRAVFETKTAYEELANDRNNLLGQLRLLCQQLHLNAVHHLGSEQHASGGAYPAIIRAIEYYQQLSHDEKQKIPPGLHQEFKRIISLVTDTTQNINNTEDTRTCIATFRANLIREMSGHEKLLSTIALGGTQKDLFIETAKNHFEGSCCVLSQALQKKAYRYGRDTLELNNELLHHLNVNLYDLFCNDQDILKSLSTNELRSMCANETLQQEIAIQLSSVDDLVFFILDMSPEQLMAFLESNHRSLWSMCIRSPRDLGALLVSKDKETCQVICMAWQNNIISMLTTEWAYREAQKNLTPEQSRVLYEAIKESLLELPWDLNRMIHSFNDFKNALEFLTPEERRDLYQQTKKNIPQLIKATYIETTSLNDVFYALQYLNTTEIEDILSFMMAPYSDLIIEYFFNDLSLELKPVVFHFIQNQSASGIKLLTQKIHSISNVLNMLTPLTPEQRQFMFHKIKDKLPKLIDVNKYKLSGQLRLNISSAVNNLSAKHCNSIFSLLGTEEREELYRLMQTKIPEFLLDSFLIEHIEIKQGSSATVGAVSRDLLKNLSPIQCKKVCQQVVPTMLKFTEPNIIHFYSILNGLSIAQTSAVTEAMDRALRKMIKSLNDYCLLFEHIDLGQREAIYEILKNRLALMIKSPKDYEQIKHWLNTDQLSELSHLVTLHQLKAVFSKELAKEFNAVMMSDDLRQIKTQIDRLIAIINFSQTRMIVFFSNRKTINQLSEIIMRLEPGWLNKVNVALALGLEEEHLRNQIEVKSIFQNYAIPQNRGHAIGYEVCTQL